MRRDNGKKSGTGAGNNKNMDTGNCTQLWQGGDST